MEKFKSKLQWVITSQQSEWPSLKILEIVNAREGVEKKGTLLHSWGECKLVQPLWKTVWRFLKELKIVTIWSCNPIPGHISRKDENSNSQRYMYPKVHSSTSYISQDMESTQMSIDRWMDKEDVVYIHNGILLSHKKEWNNAICSNMDGPRGYHVKWSKSEKDKCHMISLIHAI